MRALSEVILAVANAGGWLTIQPGDNIGVVRVVITTNGKNYGGMIELGRDRDDDDDLRLSNMILELVGQARRK